MCRYGVRSRSGSLCAAYEFQLHFETLRASSTVILTVRPQVCQCFVNFVADVVRVLSLSDQGEGIPFHSSVAMHPHKIKRSLGWPATRTCTFTIPHVSPVAQPHRKLVQHPESSRFAAPASPWHASCARRLICLSKPTTNGQPRSNGAGDM